ncbi:unnamed protein product, partial [Hymenolepis diminuta]
VLCSYSARPPASVEIPDLAVLYSEHNYVLILNLVKWGEKTRVRCPVRKLGPDKCEHYSKFILPKEFTLFSCSETVQVMKEALGQMFSFSNVRFNSHKLVIEHDEYLCDIVGVINFHCDKFGFCTITREQFRCLIFVSALQTKL